MNKEIKLRGKEIRTEEFIYSNGYYFDGINYWFILPDKDNKAIAFSSRHIVDPETIGNFTGSKDIKGKEIYKDDIVEQTSIFDPVLYTDEPTGVEKDRTYRGVVVIYPSKGVCIKNPICFDNITGKNTKIGYCKGLTASKTTKIGNKFDNPELLEVNE